MEEEGPPFPGMGRCRRGEVDAARLCQCVKESTATQISAPTHMSAHAPISATGSRFEVFGTFRTPAMPSSQRWTNLRPKRADGCSELIILEFSEANNR